MKSLSKIMQLQCTWSLLAISLWLMAEVYGASTNTTITTTDVPQSHVEIIILHNNDMHARFEQIGKYANLCAEEDVLANKCYGGFARVSTVLKRFRTDAQNGGPAVFYLNAGDTYTGTPWFTLFKDRITSDFLNILRPDAVVSACSMDFSFIPTPNA